MKTEKVEKVAQHTPTPWKAHGVMVKDTTDTLGGMYRIEMPNGEFAFCTQHEDAHFICRAVNSHADLVEALRDVLGWYRLGSFQAAMHERGESAEYNRTLKAARAALAATEGK